MPLGAARALCGSALHCSLMQQRYHSSSSCSSSAAQGFAAALALRDRVQGRTPLALAIHLGHAAWEAALRARGATS
jgi:hypothetical protein